MKEFEQQPAPPDTSGGDTQFTQRLLRMLWRGKWILMVVPALAVGLGLLYYKQAPRVYRATARLEVQQRQISLMKDQGVNTTKQRNFLKLQAEIFRSEPIIERVIHNPEVKDFECLYGDPEEGPGAQFRLKLKANGDVNTDTVSLSFDAERPKEAERVLALAIEAYLDYLRARQKGTASEAYKLVSAERERLEKELRDVTRELLDLKASHTGLSTAGRQGSNLETVALDDINRSLTTATIEAGKAQRSYEALTAKLVDRAERIRYGQKERAEKQIAHFENEVTAYQTERLDLETRLAKLRGQLTDDHPELKKVEESIQALRVSEEEVALRYADAGLEAARLKAEQAEYERASLAEAKLAQEKVVQRIAQPAREVALLELTEAETKDRLEEIRKRAREIGMSEDVGGLNATIIDNSRVNYEEPTSPQIMTVMQLAIPLGVFLALGLVILRGVTDRRFWAADEIPFHLRMPVLGMLPRGGAASDMGRAVDLDPESRLSESMRGVRSAVSFALSDSDTGTILVASALGDEGRSVTASNLAISLARTGRRTLLLDADMRDPAQAGHFSIEGGRGLADVLANGIAPSTVIHQGVRENLDVLTSGGDGSAAGAELIESARLDQVLSELRADYDCVVLDAPPVLESSEARVLGSRCDATLFVVRMLRSNISDSGRAAQSLRSVGVKLLGAVATDSDVGRRSPTYVGGFGYDVVGTAAIEDATPEAAAPDAASDEPRG
jgi:capsular exopolysaccharide synthesis family protein